MLEQIKSVLKHFGSKIRENVKILCSGKSDGI